MHLLVNITYITAYLCVNNCSYIAMRTVAFTGDRENNMK